MLETKHNALLAEARRRGRGEHAAAIEIIFRVLALASAIDRDCAERLGVHRLSEGRFVLLFLLASSEPQEALPSQLARRAGVTRATVTTLIDGLESQRFVERSRGDSDRRVVTVRLTPKGRRLAAVLMSEHTRWIAGLTRGLTSADRAMLTRVLVKLWRRTDAGRRQAQRRSKNAESATQVRG